jgi:hypothetical protein
MFSYASSSILLAFSGSMPLFVSASEIVGTMLSLLLYIDGDAKTGFVKESGFAGAAA